MFLRAKHLVLGARNLSKVALPCVQNRKLVWFQLRFKLTQLTRASKSSCASHICRRYDCHRAYISPTFPQKTSRAVSLPINLKSFLLKCLLASSESTNTNCVCGKVCTFLRAPGRPRARAAAAAAVCTCVSALHTRARARVCCPPARARSRARWCAPPCCTHLRRCVAHIPCTRRACSGFAAAVCTLPARYPLYKPFAAASVPLLRSLSA